MERGGNGQEQYYDPMNYIGPMMMGGGWPGSWKSPQDWTTRDYDRLGDIMTEWLNRQRGRQTGGPWVPSTPWMMGDNYQMPFPSGRRQYDAPCGPDIASMMARVEALANEYRNHIGDLNDQLYGSLEERKEERWKQRQFKLWREFQNMAMNGGIAGMNGGMAGMNGGLANMNGLPGINMQMPGMMNQNAGMAGMHGMMAPGMGMGVGMGAMMPQQFGAMGGMPGMGAGLGGMGMNGMMPGGALGGQMNGLGDDMYGGVGGLGGGRRRGRPFGRGRLGGLEDELDDDFAGGFGGCRGLFGRGRRGDDDAFFAGYDGE